MTSFCCSPVTTQRRMFPWVSVQACFYVVTSSRLCMRAVCSWHDHAYALMHGCGRVSGVCTCRLCSMLTMAQSLLRSSACRRACVGQYRTHACRDMMTCSWQLCSMLTVALQQLPSARVLCAMHVFEKHAVGQSVCRHDVCIAVLAYVTCLPWFRVFSVHELLGYTCDYLMAGS